jgi:hypothetical protein
MTIADVISDNISTVLDEITSYDHHPEYRKEIIELLAGMLKVIVELDSFPGEIRAKNIDYLQLGEKHLNNYLLEKMGLPTYW